MGESELQDQIIIAGDQVATAQASFDENGLATGYTLTRFVKAIAGETKSKTFNITSPTKFLELDLDVSNVSEVIDCTDASGQKWYEVSYLGQDRILN